MALNYDALKATVGLAAQRGELVLHTARGMLIADAALMKDDAVIYIAGNEPSVSVAGPSATSRKRAKSTMSPQLLIFQEPLPNE